MQLEDLTKIPQLSYKLPGSYFNLVNFTPVIEYIHNNSVKSISEFDSDVKLNNTQHKKYEYHYFIYYKFDIIKENKNKIKKVNYFDVDVKINKEYSTILQTF